MTARDIVAAVPAGAAAPGRIDIRSGWGWLAATVARAYLVLLASLAAVALLPVLLGWGASVVQSESMTPAIKPGDVVLTSPLPADREVPLGRVVSFTATGPSGEHTVLHRVVADNGDGTWMTQGDANADPDSAPLVREQITGQGRLLVPAIGLPVWWLTHGDIQPLLIWAGTIVLAIVLVSLEPSASAPVALRRRPSSPKA